MLDSPQDVLERVFGYTQFRGQQQDIIEHTLAGGDSLVLMPTGGGKSLCFQIPALIRPGITVVVSPLIALMQDQVDTLLQAGVRAAFLNSTLTGFEAQRVERELREGQIDLLYVAPERLLSERTLELLYNLDVALFAIDEAHCVSQWGHDFRPEYRRLSVLHTQFPDIPRIALTATADEPTRNEIVERLGLEKARAFIGGFDRPNIQYRVVPKNNAREQLRKFLEAEHTDDSGIVYCLSRRKVEQTAEWLRTYGFNALAYHAGMSTEERTKHQAQFLRGEGVVIVATIAFGMGIDKSNVRFVAHLDLPKSPESYYQETGRAGRDGLPANAWMAYGLQDVIMLRQMVDSSESGEDRKRLEVRKLDAMLGFCEITSCRRQTLLGYFGETLSEPCGNCDNCIEPPVTWEATEAVQKALSCVYRTGQRFGASYVTDVLLGKDNARVRSFGHHRLSTFGIGEELAADQWRSVFRQLVARGLLQVDMEGYGSLVLTDESRPILRGEAAISLRRDKKVVKSRRARTSSKSPPAASGSPETSVDQSLWDELRNRRRKIAEAQGVPPYVIFHDASLMEMLERRPQTLDEFATITGVGEKKLNRYGAEFLELLQQPA
jgi:ATP-dependent DNA helicase RecQ